MRRVRPTSGCGANPTVGNAFDKLYPLGTTLVFGETTELTVASTWWRSVAGRPRCGEKFMHYFNRYQQVIERIRQGTSPIHDQPKATFLAPDDDRGEGARQHSEIGRQCKIDGVSIRPKRPPDLAWVHGFFVAAAEMVTLCAASGYTVHFSDWPGNVIGNPILPVIKLCANPRTVRTMSEHIDVDVSGLLRREMSPDDAGDALIDMMFRTANGRLTAAEALGLANSC